MGHLTERQALDLIRATATRSFPECINLPAIDRILADVAATPAPAAPLNPHESKVKSREQIHSELCMLYARRDTYAHQWARGELASDSLTDDIWGKIYALRWALGENIQWGGHFLEQEKGELGTFEQWPLMCYCWPGHELPEPKPAAAEVPCWVRVDEQLPVPGVPVLVCEHRDDCPISLATYLPDEVGADDLDKWEYGYGEWGVPSFWMPLPAQPVVQQTVICTELQQANAGKEQQGE